MLQVKRRQGGLDEPVGQSAARAGLTVVLLHPVKQPGVCSTGTRGCVEVYDATPENTHSAACVLISRQER